MSEEHQRLSGRVSSLETDMRNVVRALESVNDSLTAINDKIQTQAKTNWGVVVSSLVAVTTILMYLGSLSLVPIKDSIEERRFTDIRQYDHINELRKRFNQERVEVIESLSSKRERIKSLKERVDRIELEQRRMNGRVYKIKPTGI